MYNPLVISTLPHYLVLFIGPTKLYNYVVFCSTTLSVLWHHSNTSANSFLGTLDHIFALIWFVTDYYYFHKIDDVFKMFLLNALTALTNMYVTYLDKERVLPYVIGHSYWHLLSAAKSLYLAHLLKKYNVFLPL
jgi:hypothetical protein